MDEEIFDFEQVFDEDYLYFYGPLLEQSRDSDAALILRLAELNDASEVLDLACGHGRIANRLGRVARVTGLDASPLFLERARGEAERDGVSVDYVEGDMRELAWEEGRFDCVISWFTSFGYFDDETNRGVLREIYRVLRPGGRLLIENNNLVELLPRWLPAVMVERDGDIAIDRPSFDPVTARATTERTTVRDGRVRRFTFSVRMFLAAELRDWVRAAGFEGANFYGPDGSRLTRTSRRMITVAGR